MRTRTLLSVAGSLPASLALAAFASPASAQDRHWVGGSGLWSNAANWLPQDVPNTIGENAILDAAGTYLVEFNLAADLGSLTLTNPLGTMVMNAGTRLALAGNVSNGSSLTVNRAAATPDTWVVLLTNVTCSGSGSIELNAHPVNVNSAALGWYVGGERLTNAAGHTIRGTGAIYPLLTNDGVIAADHADRTLVLLGNPKTNNATLSARNGGTLALQAHVTQAPNAEISGDGGTVDVYDVMITGGHVSNKNNGAVRIVGAPLFADVTTEGAIDVLAGHSISVTDALVNNAIVTLNPTGATPDTYLRASSSHTISGSGTVVLNAHPVSLNSSAIAWYTGTEVVTNAAGHTIRGTGAIYPTLVNDGTIRADHADRTLLLLGNAKTNNALVSATNSGVLQVSAPITQAATGQIVGDGGRVDFADSSLTGGTLATMNTGLAQVVGAATFTNVSLDGTLHVLAGRSLSAVGSLGNSGHIVVNPTGATPDTALRLIGNLSLEGAGEVVLAAHAVNLNSAAIAWYSGPEILTNTATHTIRGTGAIWAATVNRGTITADSTGRELQLLGAAKLNEGTLRAENGGRLLVTTDVSGAGRIVADGGEVRFAGGTTTGAAISSLGTGLVSVAAPTVFVNCSLAGLVDIPYNSRMVLSGTLTNHGTVRVNPTSGTPDTSVQLVANTVLTGNGSLGLHAHPANMNSAAIAWYTGGETLTQAAGHAITGRGAIYPTFVNQGVLSPGEAGDDGLLQMPGMRALTNAPTAELAFDLFSATRSDRIVSNGPIALDGTLTVRFAPGYSPHHGTYVTLLQGASITGTFAHRAIPAGTRVIYSPTMVKLLDACVADVDDGTGSGTPDGGVTIDDLLFYLQLLFDGDIRADCDDGSFTGTPDGGVTIDDLLYFLSRFTSGC